MNFNNEYNPLAFIKEIHKRGVKYLLIGRQAVIAYGGPLQTMDYDIYVDSSIENINLLLEIADKFSLSPSVAKEKIPTLFKFKLENDFVIDVFKVKYFVNKEGKKIAFTDLYQRRKIAEGEKGLKINLPHIADLIYLKEIRSSPKDLEDIKYLKTIIKLENDAK